MAFGLIWLSMYAVVIYFIVRSYYRQGSAWEFAQFMIAGLAFFNSALIILLILLQLSNRKIDRLTKKHKE